MSSFLSLAAVRVAVTQQVFGYSFHPHCATSTNKSPMGRNSSALMARKKSRLRWWDLLMTVLACVVIFNPKHRPTPRLLLYGCNMIHKLGTTYAGARAANLSCQSALSLPFSLHFCPMERQRLPLSPSLYRFK
jgi:hypothetical protein